MVEDGLIHSIVRPLKSGKEADLFIVETSYGLAVTKVYRERKFRSFKKDAGYKDGRTIRNTRSQRALNKSSAYGRALAERAWHLAEVEALRTLARAGARVPRVLAHHEQVLLIELICDRSGEPAPQLAQVSLSPRKARKMYEQVLEQVVLMLMHDLVHADLSPYNILVRDGQPVIIDLPQCVSAAHNQQAGQLLERDVHAVSQHLGLVDPAIRKLGELAWQLWAEYEAGTLTAGFRPDPKRKRPSAVEDIAGLVAFVKSARDDAELVRRAAAGDADAAAQVRAADRRAARTARRAAEARSVIAAEQERSARRKAAGKKKRRTSSRRARPGAAPSTPARPTPVAASRNPDRNPPRDSSACAPRSSEPRPRPLSTSSLVPREHVLADGGGPQASSCSFEANQDAVSPSSRGTGQKGRIEGLSCEARAGQAKVSLLAIDPPARRLATGVSAQIPRPTAAAPKAARVPDPAAPQAGRKLVEPGLDSWLLQADAPTPVQDYVEPPCDGSDSMPDDDDLFADIL